MSTKDRIKQVRKTIGLTQGEFGKRISISTSYLAGIECGDKKINERVIRLICMEFKVNGHWLKTGEGEMYDKKADTNLSKFIGLFNSLKPKFQECAIEQLKALSELNKSESGGKQ